MKASIFTANNLSVERRETREGPSPYFVVYYKNTSRITTDVKSIKRQLKLGRGTETLQQLNDWLESFEKQTQTQNETPRHIANAA